MPNLEADFEDFFENSLCGFVIASPDGTVRRTNLTAVKWLGYPHDELVGSRFSSFLSIAGKVYYETNLAPLLRMQGFFDEVALDLLTHKSEKLPVILNASERRDEAGVPVFLRIAIFRASERRRYERNLLEAKTQAVATSVQLRERIAEQVKDRLEAETVLADERHTSALREQFIAVLGHDLRNPLASIDAGIRILAKTPLTEKALEYTYLLQKSVARMATLIDNVMDFARGRLGGGLSLQLKLVKIEPVLNHVIQELRVAWPQNVITTEFDIELPVHCDPDRLAQLLSNLVANALTHGASEGPVRIKGSLQDGIFNVSVANLGDPIPPDIIGRLFQPFTRDEVRPSQQGLGLGLYIASEIARAHGGELTAVSSVEETRFTFQMPVE